MKLVLNSHRFWRDIAPEVLRNLPPDEEPPIPSNSGIQGDPLLLDTILSSQHTILITSGIETQYVQEATREGYDPSLIFVITQQLVEQRAVARPRLPGGRQRIRGIPERHHAFLEDAIRASADYFVTKNPVWLDLGDSVLRDHSLRIVTPDGFINRESK